MGKLIETGRAMTQPGTDAGQPGSPSTGTVRLNGWLATLVELGGSDLLLIPGAPASIRLEGEVRKIESEPLEGPEIETAVLPALTPHGLRLYQQNHIGDSSYRIEGLGRFRINLHYQQGRAAAAIRALPTALPSLRELHLPSAVESLARLRR